ncbi:MAG: prepilin-type N-terminal cleavage/methylation domain-containing protein [Bacilli bacterium]|nr:prepilin-type N-terminal cleavage/methylation domain-containing protein [Bacilli bacterium]
MKKNNKGFTLVELMAVIVIMGILSIIVIPKISDLVLETKEEIYVQDAKKLLAQAQYRMNSNSIEIEKPEMGECIVFSLKYLNINDFRNPPNNGTYLDESSFVVVRNVEGNFDYAVLLIEHRKDGLFQGVEFVTEQQLNARDAIKHVRYFESRDIRYIDIEVSEKNNGDFVDTLFINSQLTKSGAGTNRWVEDNSIIGTYNEAAMREGTVADAAAPKFTAKITSNQVNEDFGTLGATLTVSAVDADDALNTLTVCVRIDNQKDGEYPSVSNNSSLCESYGERKYYIKNVDFGQYGFNYEDNHIAYVYITVSDPGGNFTHKLVEYNIHQSEGPKISKMLLTRRTQDVENLPTSTLSVEVSSDYDKVEDLKVCFEQDIPSEEEISDCHGDYVSYYDVFSKTGHMDYLFKKPDGTAIESPDGSTHTLTMFVKDSKDRVGFRTAEYSLYRNEDPKIVSFSILPEKIIDANGDTYNSLYYTINLVVEDDLNTRDVMIRIGDEDPITYNEFIRMERNANKKHRAPGLFDGTDREVIVEVWDKYQTEEVATFASRVITHVYKNEAPFVQSATITSKGTICLDNTNNHCASNIAPEKGGSYTVSVNLTAGDALLTQQRDFNQSVKVCINENPSECSKDKTQNFVAYKKTFDYTFSSPEGLEKYAEPETKHLYIALMEEEKYNDHTEYYYSLSDPYDYKVYSNDAPSFANDKPFVIRSAVNGEYNYESVSISFSNLVPKDDFNHYMLAYCYSVDGGETICTENMSKTDFENKFKLAFIYKNADGSSIQSYEGQKIDSYVLITDHRGLQAESPHVLYELLTDDYPEIQDVILQSNETRYNSNTIIVHFKVKDVGDTYEVCFKEKKDGVCTDADYRDNDGVPYNGSLSGQNVRMGSLRYKGSWSSDYTEANPEKEFYLAVKDSHGNVTNYSQELNYTVYLSCKENMAELNTIFTPANANSQISMNYCSGKCLHYYPSSYNRDPNEIFATYIKKVNYRDNNIGRACPPSEEETPKTCEYYTCFDHPEYLPGQSTPFAGIFVGLVVQPTNKEWTDKPAGVTNTVLVDKPECKNLKKREQLLFVCDNDSYCENRCKNKTSYCNTQADTICDDSSNYDQCFSSETTKCMNSLNQFCNKGLEESMYEVTCNSENESDPNVVVRNCRTDRLNGKCYQNDTCSAQDFENSICQKVCYKKINCADEYEQVQAEYKCHGYLTVYESHMRNNAWFLQATGERICPEYFNDRPGNFVYDPTSNTPYILFNENEQSEIFEPDMSKEG